MNILLKLGYNTFIQILGKGLAVLLGFITVSILTRYLGTGAYGSYTLVFAYLSFFSSLSDFGIQLTAIKDIAEKKTDPATIYTSYLSLKLVLTLISIVIPLIVMVFIPYTENVKVAILIGSIGVAVGSMLTYGNTLFQVKVRLDLITLTDISSRLITVALILLCILLRLNLFFIIASVGLGNCVGLATQVILLKNELTFKKIDVVYSRKLFLSSVPIGITLFFSAIYFKVDTFLLSLFKSSVDVGIYSLSYKIIENILVLWGFYMSTLYPLIAQAKQENSDKKYKYILCLSIFIALISSLIFLVVGFLLAPLAINILGGNAFYQGILPLRILLFSVPFFFFNNFFYYYFLLKNKKTIIVVTLTCSLVFNIGINLFLIPKYGYIGASYATVITEIALTCLYGVLKLL